MTMRNLQTNQLEPPLRGLRFHTEVTALLAGVVRYSSAFTCVGRKNALAYCYVRCDEESRTVAWSRLDHVDNELGTDGGICASRSPASDVFRRGEPRAEGADRLAGDVWAISVALQSEGRSFGLVGLERARTELPFSSDERREVQARAHTAGLAARHHVEREQVACELAAFQTLGRTDGLLLMIDRDREEIFWAHRRGGYVDWADEVGAIAVPLLSAIGAVTGRRTLVRIDCASGTRDVEAARLAEKYADLANCVVVRVSDACEGSIAS